jgi:2-aminoadipate transaminase
VIEIFNSIKLDKESKTPLYIQLSDKLKDLIMIGSLLPDFRLPSIRKISEILEVNQITVVTAYKLLEQEGYVYSKPGSGTYVSNNILMKATQGSSHISSISDELYLQDDIPLINSGQIQITDDTINFASATPTPDLFPVEDFKLVINETLDRDMGNAFSYQEGQGYYPLRECIPEILKNSRIMTTAENIQIISGAQQGIDIISKAFLKQGDYVITESPTYTGAIAVFKSRGAQILDIELEENGPNLSILEYNLKKYRPRLIYTIPSFQNPTGFSYSNYKREQILKLAEKYSAYIIEDGYISDLDFDGRNYIPIKAIDMYNRVIFIKSFSKIFMPGLRLGFMIAPLSLQGKILEAKHTTDISTSGLIQRAFNLYIRKGFWDKHLTFMYKIYKERYLRMLSALDKNLPEDIKYSKPGGGLNLWLNLPFGSSVNNLLKAAAASNIIFAPGKIFYSDLSPQKLNSLRLSYAAVDSHQIEPGIEKLCKIMANYQKKQEHYRNMPIL